MNFNKAINLFELTEKITDRFRSESGFELTGYEFSFKFKRDWNCPINRIFINFLIFGEDYAHTVFDEKYDTEDKVIELLFLHLRDDAGVENLKDGLITAKRLDLDSRLEKLTERIDLISTELLASKGKNPLIVMVDEKYPYNSIFYENGFPVYQYQVYTQDSELKLYFDLDYNLREFDADEVFATVEREVEKYVATYSES